MPLVGEPRVVLNLLLEFHDGVENSFRSWRAAGNVHVHRYDLVDALHHMVRTIKTAASGARTHRDDPLWFGHLIIDLLQNRAHLVVDGSEHHKNIGLLW